MTQTDRIEKQVILKAPPARVWRALADAEEFGSWFGVRLNSGFAVGERATGNLTHAGYEHLKFELLVERLEPERSFAFRWHPYAIDPAIDYSAESMTLVEFHLEPVEGGTRLVVVESGFDAIPASRRETAFRMNGEGWAIQCDNLQRHVDG